MRASLKLGSVEQDLLGLPTEVITGNAEIHIPQADFVFPETDIKMWEENPTIEISFPERPALRAFVSFKHVTFHE